MSSVSRVRVLIKTVLLAVALAACAAGTVLKGMYVAGQPSLFDGVAPGDWRNDALKYTALTAAAAHALVVVGQFVPFLTGEYYEWNSRMMSFGWGVTGLASFVELVGMLVFYFATIGSLDAYKAKGDLSPFTGLISVASLFQAIVLRQFHTSSYSSIDENTTVKVSVH